MVTDHEMRMYALDLFEILKAVDHTLTVHGKIDCGTPLHHRIAAALTIPNKGPSGQRRGTDAMIVESSLVKPFISID